MSISKFNAERYYDPTTYEALTNIEREERLQKRKQQRPYMPKVYICSPFSGDTKLNIRNARRYCAFAVKAVTFPMQVTCFFLSFSRTTIRESVSWVSLWERSFLTAVRSAGCSAAIFQAVWQRKSDVPREKTF